MTPNATTFNESRVSAALKAVVFDLDDTLYAQQEYVFSGFRAVAHYVRNLYGVDIFEDLRAAFLAGDRTDLFHAVLNKRFKKVEEALVRKLVYVHRTHAPRLELATDARVCLAQLIARGIKIGVVTEGPASMQKRKVAALNIEALIDALVYTDELIGPKFSAQVQEDALQIIGLQLGADPAEMAFVGDNPLADFLVPRRLGMRTARIRRSRGECAEAEPPAPEYAPHITIHSLCLLADALETAPFSK